jgi:SAM-dependent methyltransferase
MNRAAKTMEPWSKQSIIEFHHYYEGDYAADVIAPLLIRLSKKYIKGRVLDIGAGSGALISRLPNSIGLDLVSKHRRMVVGDIAQLPFKNEAFSTVFATALLEHLDDVTLEWGLREVTRVLSRNGKLILTVPHEEDLRQNMVLCPKCGAKFHRYGHMQVFERRSIRSVLEDVGFKILEIRVLPLGFIATQPLLRHFRYILEKLGFLKSQDMFIVAVKE